jgi:hypothetical protein
MAAINYHPQKTQMSSHYGTASDGQDHHPSLYKQVCRCRKWWWAMRAGDVGRGGNLGGQKEGGPPK